MYVKLTESLKLHVFNIVAVDPCKFKFPVIFALPFTIKAVVSLSMGEIVSFQLVYGCSI